MDVKVAKKDGRLEDFDADKIARVVTTAGLKPQDGFMLAIEIANWVRSLKNDSITSKEIRQKVIEKMKAVDEKSANVYIWYENLKDKQGLN